MARPKKQGLDYFPLDSQFLSDIKVRKIVRAQGTNAIAVIISLLCNIYRDEGYFIQRDDDVSFIIADEVGVKEEYVNEVIDKAIQVGFFDENKYDEFHILTSNGIQKRFLEATDRRKEVEFNENFRINVNENIINVNINTINDNKSTQSKVKESKVKESKEEVDKNFSASPASTQLLLLSRSIVIEQWCMMFHVDKERMRECIKEFVEFKFRHQENNWTNERDLSKNFEFWLKTNAQKKVVKPQKINHGNNLQQAKRR